MHEVDINTKRIVKFIKAFNFWSLEVCSKLSFWITKKVKEVIISVNLLRVQVSQSILEFKVITIIDQCSKFE